MNADLTKKLKRAEADIKKEIQMLVQLKQAAVGKTGALADSLAQEISKVEARIKTAEADIVKLKTRLNKAPQSRTVLTKSEKIMFSILVTLFILWALAVRYDNQRKIARLQAKNEVYEEQHRAEVSKCIERGIEQYKLFGSYPTLTTGQSARLVAIDACAKDATVYGTEDVK